MTVQELIRELKKYPSDSDVIVSISGDDLDGDDFDPSSVEGNSTEGIVTIYIA